MKAWIKRVVDNVTNSLITLFVTVVATIVVICSGALATLWCFFGLLNEPRKISNVQYAVVN